MAGSLDDRIDAVRARIAGACARARRDPADVTLIAVTKTHAPDAIEAAYRAGLRDFGENRVQEAAPKIDALRGRMPAVRWHMIGQLQSNKIAAALKLFDIVHTVDSLRLAEGLSRRATRPIPVLIEVNVAAEPTKQGIAPAEVATLAEAVRSLPNIQLAGLMTVAPRVENPEGARPVFRDLRRLGDELGVRELSMGMTDDFEVAIEEGATMVRVGRAIFGDRPHVTRPTA